MAKCTALDLGNGSSDDSVREWLLLVGVSYAFTVAELTTRKEDPKWKNYLSTIKWSELIANLP